MRGRVAPNRRLQVREQAFSEHKSPRRRPRISSTSSGGRSFHPAPGDCLEISSTLRWMSPALCRIFSGVVLFGVRLIHRREVNAMGVSAMMMDE